MASLSAVVVDHHHDVGLALATRLAPSSAMAALPWWPADPDPLRKGRAKASQGHARAYQWTLGSSVGVVSHRDQRFRGGTR